MSYNISSGQVSNGITLNHDFMYVYSGGVANDTTVNSGGYLDVSSGGTANSANVNGGYLVVRSGGTALNVAWTPCVGMVDAADGAIVTFAGDYQGVYFGSDGQLLSSALTMSSMTLSGHSMYVMNGISRRN